MAIRERPSPIPRQRHDRPEPRGTARSGAHATRLAQEDKYARHLREAGRLGNQHALLDLAQALGHCVAHFSDRGHLFQVDRGRRFSAIVDAQGMRASEYLMYFNHQTCFRTSVAKRFG